MENCLQSAWSPGRHKGWPVTAEDERHVDDNYEFIECAIPSITNVRTSKSEGLLDKTFEVTWNYDPGCVSKVTVDNYRFKIKDSLGFTPYKEVDGEASSFVENRLKIWPDYVLLMEAHLVPEDKVLTLGPADLASVYTIELNVNY